jgi:putative acetyltransferase
MQPASVQAPDAWSLREARAAGELAIAAELFAEYAGVMNPLCSASFAQQGFDDERASLPGKYAAPGGVILIGYWDEVPVACGAVRPAVIDDASPGAALLAGRRCGEIKRMYLRPQLEARVVSLRGRGLGRLLLAGLMEFGQRAGYDTIVLDTAPQLLAATKLYEQAGFVMMPRYNADPDPQTIWMRRELR